MGAARQCAIQQLRNGSGKQRVGGREEGAEGGQGVAADLSSVCCHHPRCRHRASCITCVARCRPAPADSPTLTLSCMRPRPCLLGTCMLQAVRAMGRCAVSIEGAAKKCINVLLELIQTKVNYVVQEAVIVIKVGRCEIGEEA